MAGVKNQISVGILLYRNNEQEIRKCLDGLKRLSLRPLIREVLIRDQGGECKEAVDSWVQNNPAVLPILFSEGKNLGFGGGHNALFAAAHPDSVAYLCLNPDGIMHPGCLEALYQMACRNRFSGIYEARQEPIMHPKYYDPRSGETAWCSGACLLIPSAIYREIKGFDEDFFLYCEDVDLSWRVKAAGHGCFTCSDAMFLHYAVDRSVRDLETWRSACILAQKWRAEAFKKNALKTLASLVDVPMSEIGQDIEKYARHDLDSIYRARPDFRHGLIFSRPMWG